MTKEEIIEYLYENNVRGDLTIEQMAEDLDRPPKVIAQITFDEEKLREIVKEAVERFKEEYEIADRPQGEWERDGHHIRCKRCNIFMCDTDREGDKLPTNYCPNCGARMKGADSVTIGYTSVDFCSYGEREGE